MIRTRHISQYLTWSAARTGLEARDRPRDAPANPMGNSTSWTYSGASATCCPERFRVWREPVGEASTIDAAFASLAAWGGLGLGRLRLSRRSMVVCVETDLEREFPLPFGRVHGWRQRMA